VLDLQELRAEREQLKKVSEVESLIVASMAKQRQLVAERRAGLEVQLAEAMQALEQRKQEAEQVMDQAATLKAQARAGQGLEEAWQEVEDAEAEVKVTEACLACVRARQAHSAVEARGRGEEASSLYQVYTAATGVRLFPQETGEVEGYVALADRIRPLEGSALEQEAGPSAVAAEKLWEAIEACLPVDIMHPVVGESPASADDEPSSLAPEARPASCCKEEAKAVDAQPSCGGLRVREASRGGG